ncbi:MAG: preprotein translocase subunit YajC [Rhodospirillaceae bacterium]|jgi:preprotein translocase subunit YajC|nr:preprotein translocase subunit YajC [Rhodospirillaceae bacterium]MBT4220206.1 preprotein translocase subunit YajC [Rhodospirillaceae bacterium]MBT4464405.1 preprotein translocase subunit YajC [Rhodospirillaceae bacterium]MBT5013230.1 preprotein translocase subunit YajC [Rhodospirillaceae bacterium]MBT5308018.1 preprotein translocase subunit YajC [Rhodospirillaceae bacterium]
MFVSTAYAQSAGAAQGGGLEAMFPLVLIFVVFYFLLIRPQQKKAKEHKGMLESIRRGDRVVTGGGIIGTVSKVIDDAELTVEIAPDIKVRVQRSLVAVVLSKTEPVNDDKKDKKKDSGDKGGDDKPKSGASKLKGLLGGKS